MRKRTWIVGGVLLAVLILLSLPVRVSIQIKRASRDHLAPLQRVVRFLLEQGRIVFRPFAEARQAKAEKERLLGDIAALSVQMQDLRAVDRENDILRRLLDFKQRQKHRLILCQVLSRGGTMGWWQTLRLNRGRRHGIEPDMPVVTAEGLVGRTGGLAREGEEGDPGVSELTADVLLITDANCRIACRFPRTGALGILRGTAGKTKGRHEIEALLGVPSCRLDYLSCTCTILPGDEVVTSGLGGVFPEGLLVGHVTRVEMDRSGLYQRAEVAPSARLDDITYVFVVAPERKVDAATGEDSSRGPGETLASEHGGVPDRAREEEGSPP